MKILFVSAEYPPQTDGIGSYVASIAPALAARGHDVHVLTCVPGQPWADEDDRGVVVHRRGRPPLRGAARALRSPAAGDRLSQALAVRREHRRLGIAFDVIEAPDWLAEGLLLTGTPTVAHLHTPVRLVVEHNHLELDWNQRVADLLERLAVRRATTITAPSTLLVEALSSTGWLPRRAQVQVLGYPVDLTRWSGSRPAGETTPRVMMVGRLEARKNPEVLIDACALLAARIPRLEAVFVGRSDGEREGTPYGAWIEARARAVGVRCIHIPHVPRHELREWYASARVVAVPSWFDNYPMVTLEALASGRPVVCSDRTGSADLIAGTQAGSVVPAGDAPALAAALRPFLEDASHAGRAGQEALALARRRCCPDKVAEQRERIYLDASRRGSHRRRGGVPSSA